MSYVELGSRTAKGVADTTGNNTGKWTVTFTPVELSVNIPYFEVYKVIIHGAANSTMNWFVDNNQWETTVAADDNAWDPAQPLLMMPGKNMYFYWSDPTTDNTPPTVTIWMRYDPSIDANQRSVHR